MSPLISPQPETAEVLQVPRHDRWRILYRLQELDLTCGCTPTGQLWVMTRTPTEALSSTVCSACSPSTALAG